MFRIKPGIALDDNIVLDILAAEIRCPECPAVKHSELIIRGYLIQYAETWIKGGTEISVIVITTAGSQFQLFSNLPVILQVNRIVVPAGGTYPVAGIRYILHIR